MRKVSHFADNIVSYNDGYILVLEGHDSTQSLYLQRGCNQEQRENEKNYYLDEQKDILHQ